MLKDVIRDVALYVVCFVMIWLGTCYVLSDKVLTTWR